MTCSLKPGGDTQEISEDGMAGRRISLCKSRRLCAGWPECLRVLNIGKQVDTSKIWEWNTAEMTSLMI